MPRWITLGILVLAVAALLPVACIARARASRAPVTRLNLVPDMDNQPRYGPQAPAPVFPDGRAMRLPPPGTVPHQPEAADDQGPTGQLRRTPGAPS